MVRPGEPQKAEEPRATHPRQPPRVSPVAVGPLWGEPLANLVLQGCNILKGISEFVGQIPAVAYEAPRRDLAKSQSRDSRPALPPASKNCFCPFLSVAPYTHNLLVSHQSGEHRVGVA